MDQPTEQELEEMYLASLEDQVANDPYLKWIDSFIRELEVTRQLEEEADGQKTV